MTTTKKQAIWNAQIVKRAIVDSFKKLSPKKMMGNPVMFVVEVGSVLTTLQHCADSWCDEYRV
jgi:K+-transporting ATPase ATPase B chain